MRCEFLRKHRQPRRLIDSGLAVLLYFFQVRDDVFDFGLRDVPLLRIFLIKLFRVLEQSPRPLWAHSSKDHFVSNETSAETTASLSAMKLPELKALAASRGLKGISQLRKSQLIELLSNGAGASTPQEKAPREDAPASPKKKTGKSEKPAARRVG